VLQRAASALELALATPLPLGAKITFIDLDTTDQLFFYRRLVPADRPPKQAIPG